MKLREKNIQISVVIPAFNVSKYLKEAVNSILKQTLLPHEIIIVEDCSNDDTYSIAMQLAESTDFSIKVYRQEKNGGVSAARNKGIELAQSEWILFMDADDIADPKLIESECQRICELQKEWKVPVVLVHSAYRQIAEDGQPLGILEWKQVKPEEILGYQFVRNHIITPTGVLVNKAAVLQVRGFDNDLRYSEDWDLWLKLASVGGFGYVDEPLVYVRRHTGNASGKLENMLGGEKTILNRYDISAIEQAINKRNLPSEVNQANLIELLYRLDKWEDGYLLASTLISRYPKYSTGHFLNGLYNLHHQSWDKAKKSFLATIEYNPQHGASLNNLGAVLAILGDADQSKKMLESALLLFPRYMDAQHNLDLLQQQGQISNIDAKFTWRELRPVLLSYNNDVKL